MYVFKEQEKNIKKQRSKLHVYLLLQKLSSRKFLGGSNLDNKSRENIIMIINLRVLLKNKKIAALVADRVKSFSLSYHVNFVANLALNMKTANHNKTHKHNYKEPLSCISYGPLSRYRSHETMREIKIYIYIYVYTEGGRERERDGMWLV